MIFHDIAHIFQATKMRFIFIAACIFFLLGDHLSCSIRVKESLPWNTGLHHSYGWYGYLITLCLGISLNSFSLYLIGFKKRVSGISLANLIFTLNLIDLMMSWECFVQCVMNVSHGEMYGHQYGCQFQALFVGFFTFWEACTLALISYCLERKVCAGRDFSNKELLPVVIASALFSFFFASCAAYLPFGGYHLYSSGTYCFYNMSNPVAGAAFAFGIVIPTIIMAHRYSHIWKSVSAAQAILHDRGMDIKAKARYSHMAQKMSCFILTFFGTATPYLICAVYEWVTEQYTPPWLDVIAGVALHTAAVINPILFFVLNDDVKDILWEEYGYYLSYFTYFLPREKHSRVKPIRIKRTFEADRASKYSSVYDTEKEWELWVHDRSLSPIFGTWCEQNFVGENFMFHKEVTEHTEMGERVRGKFLWALKNCPELLPQDALGVWNGEFYKSTAHIYEMYIKIPTAPLEVNIPALTNIKIQKCLGITPEFKAVKSNIIPQFPDLTTLSAEELSITVQNISNVYEEAFTIICAVIASDVFPRFKRSPQYIQTCTDENLKFGEEVKV